MRRLCEAAVSAGTGAEELRRACSFSDAEHADLRAMAEELAGGQLAGIA
jgi:hypothetical protein